MSDKKFAIICEVDVVAEDTKSSIPIGKIAFCSSYHEKYIRIQAPWTDKYVAARLKDVDHAIKVLKGESFLFKNTYCSQCGQEFGAGNHGFSHCKDHQKRRRTP